MPHVRFINVIISKFSSGKSAKFHENLNKTKYMKCFQAHEKFQTYITKCIDKKRQLLKKLKALKILCTQYFFNCCTYFRVKKYFKKIFTLQF